MHGAMTATTERDQSFEGFASETLGGAAVDVVTQRPFDPAHQTMRFAAVPLVPVVHPAFSERNPFLAGHVVAIGGMTMKVTR